MKSTQETKIMKAGRHEWEHTQEYRTKVAQIVKEVMDSYSTTLTNEKSWLKRLVINLKIEMAIRKRMNEFSSRRNLHTLGSPL